jgi:hypothetical protein
MLLLLLLLFIILLQLHQHNARTPPPGLFCISSSIFVSARRRLSPVTPPSQLQHNKVTPPPFGAGIQTIQQQTVSAQPEHAAAAFLLTIFQGFCCGN